MPERSLPTLPNKVQGQSLNPTGAGLIVQKWSTKQFIPLEIKEANLLNLPIITDFGKSSMRKVQTEICLFKDKEATKKNLINKGEKMIAVNQYSNMPHQLSMKALASS